MAEHYYKEVLGSVEGLRRGLTTGSCAQAAAKGALLFLLTGYSPKEVSIRLPESNTPYGGKEVVVPVESARRLTDATEVLVRKDSGDDSDNTHGLLIGARVTILGHRGVKIDGGQGVGKITVASGLPGKKGESAINPVPRKMITAELEALLPPEKGCDVLIFVPEGEKAAIQTWNARIGVTGGISILGTKGVVEPKSERAYTASIGKIISAYREKGVKHFIITPGYVGETYLKSRGVALNRVVTAGDHLGYALKAAVAEGAEKVIVVGHIGKLAKVAAGIFNTHYKYGDGRLETIAACAAACGASPPLVRKLLELELAEEAVEVLRQMEPHMGHEQGVEDVYTVLCRRINTRISKLIKGAAEPGSIILSLKGDPLGAVPVDPLEGWVW